MRAELAEAIDVLLADVRAGGAPEPNIEDNDYVHDPSRAAAMIRWDDGTGRGVDVSLDWSQAGILVSLADQFQEEIVEQLCAEGRSAVWPECPYHPSSHPLKPELVDEVALWVCPRSYRPIGLIGSLGSYP